MHPPLLAEGLGFDHQPVQTFWPQVLLLWIYTMLKCEDVGVGAVLEGIVIVRCEKAGVIFGIFLAFETRHSASLHFTSLQPPDDSTISCFFLQGQIIQFRYFVNKTA